MLFCKVTLIFTNRKIKANIKLREHSFIVIIGSLPNVVAGFYLLRKKGFNYCQSYVPLSRVTFFEG